MTTPASWTVGLIGRGIGQSRSPKIHEAEARELGLELEYRLIDFAALELDDEALGAMVARLAEQGYSGSNVTFPFKQVVLPFCDRLSEAAAILGAVNTLTFGEDGVSGENTDWIGFSWLIEREIGSIAAARIAQVGAGGAGSATAFALARLGAGELALHDPMPGRAEALAGRLAPHFPACRLTVHSDPAGAIAGSKGVVNATPVGMASVPGMPFDPGLMQADQWFADIIYFPLETELLAAARRNGQKVANGVSMVAGQAAAAFRLFTGLEPDRERMLARLNTEIAAERRMGDAA